MMGWETATLKEVGKIVSGGTPKSKVSEYWNGEIAWVTPADLSNYNEVYIGSGRRNITLAGLENSSAKVMPAGSVLFSSRAPVGYVAIAENEISTNQGFKSIVPYEFIDSKFLYYYLSSITGLANNRASGTTFKELSKKAFGQLPISYPPLPEQRAIVAKLDALLGVLDRSVGALRGAAARLGIYRESVLREAFAGRLTEAWRGERAEGLSAEDLVDFIREDKISKYDEAIASWRSAKKQKGAKIKKPRAPFLNIDIEPSSVASMDSLPTEWCWVKMGAVVSEVVVGYVGPVTKHLTDNGDKVRFLSTTHIGESGFKNEDVRFVTRSFHESNRKSSVIPGDILVARHGDSGRSVIVPDYIKEAQVSNAVIVRPNQSYTDRQYLLYAFNFLRTFLQRKKVGGVFQVVNTKTMESFPIPYCSLSEQRRIVAEIESRLSVGEALEREVAGALKRAEGLRMGVLKRAFGGELVREEELAIIAKYSN